MLDIDNLHFQKLDKEGLKTLIAWAADEGWNPGPNDADAFWEADPDGYYGYFHEGILIAGGSIVSYGGKFGFMGFFIVKPEYRSLGIGRRLWHQRRDKLLSRLVNGASVGMDGVVAMQGFYEKGGFAIAYRDERHEKIGEGFHLDKNITAIEKHDHKSILDYDKACFGYYRPQFLIAWLNLPHVKTFKYAVNGSIKGYSVLRKVTYGYKICPLFAEEPAIAEELYKACLNAVVGAAVYIDIPVSNPAAVELTKKYKTNYVFECARMYYGKFPEVEIEKVFGLTSFELG